jgi:competence protein ComGC
VIQVRILAGARNLDFRFYDLKFQDLNYKIAPIAQLAEQSPLKRTVEGSNPSGRILWLNRFKNYFFEIMKNQKGFIPIEFLIIIGICAFLISIVFFAIDPTKKFAEARNDRRWEDVSLILEAVLKYDIDHGGTLPDGIDSLSETSQVLGANASGCDAGCSDKTTVAACLDLSNSLVDKYLTVIPYDPYSGSSAFTDYYINQSASGRIEVGACDPELGATIFVSR